MAIQRIRPVWLGAVVLASVLLVPHPAAAQNPWGMTVTAAAAVIVVFFLQDQVNPPKGLGHLRLKVKPRDAEVFVNGYFVGLVDEFDGVLQRLHVQPGPCHIEFRAAGHQPLTFDVLIQPDRTRTYKGELKTVP